MTGKICVGAQLCTEFVRFVPTYLLLIAYLGMYLHRYVECAYIGTYLYFRVDIIYEFSL